RRFLHSFHCTAPPPTALSTLSLHDALPICIARALSQDARLIIMDEPSAVLDNEEVARLFGVIRDLRADGVAVLYISHRLEEIREDRKSTRLNSSHVKISYAVFCLKKKNEEE